MIKLRFKLAVFLGFAVLVASTACTQTEDERSPFGDYVAESDDVDSTPTVVEIETFTELLSIRSKDRFDEHLSLVSSDWEPAYTPMLLEVGRFLRPPARKKVIALLESNTGQTFGNDFDQWWQWVWKQKLEPDPDYGQFKSDLYSRIDPSFTKYFEGSDFADIRLDEIRWGGVPRDGIPPLKDPAMVSAKDASYLADSDVVFGIELNGDARCYPKRILAWHEMFKDTIGGESICGVY